MTTITSNSTKTFRAVLIEKNGSEQSTKLIPVKQDSLPSGDVLVKVEHSTINYKDGLALTGKSPVVRSFPMIPGIDFCGTVVESSHKDWKPGDRAILNGWGTGETRWGGLSELAKTYGDWLVPLPHSLSSQQAMAIGTAGYTAMLSVMALERHQIKPSAGPILVTGASGGVGSIAVSLLSHRGYQVVASTGKLEAAGYLTSLGATSIIERNDISAPGKSLQKEKWAGAIDTVGSTTLANICASLQYGAVATTCGMAQGLDFPSSVAPFILRGITLCGIDSVMAPLNIRQEAWKRLAAELDLRSLEAMTVTIPLDEVQEAGHRIVEGKVRGRIVVDVGI